mgnify:CR=1 FL=1
MKLYVMDAFANRIFGGNQAGVALPDRELSDETMRQIAAEMKHSETAFIHMEPDGSVSLRYFTPAGEVDLCGHATIGVGTALQEIGLVPDEHKDAYVIETPAGLVTIHNNFNADKTFVKSCSIKNVNSYVIENEIRIDVDDIKDIPVNIAYGGNVFAIVPAARFNVEIKPADAQKIKYYSAKIRQACDKIIGKDEYKITLVQWYDTPKYDGSDLRVVHSSGYGSPDRSPGGTGTSAKLAWLGENGLLKVDQPFVHEGIVDGKFIGKIKEILEVNGRKEYVTEITGEARITGFHKFVFDEEDDPLVEGFLFE